MRIAEMNWFQVEDYLKRDNRCVLPIGSTEQHAYLSLCTDAILAEKISADAAEPLQIPVFPVQSYGITPSFMSFPGTISLKIETMFALVGDMLESLSHHGFRKVLIVNGHGGNAPLANFVQEWCMNKPLRAKFYNWWNAPKTWAAVQAVDEVASHASWMENFPWTRLQNIVQPNQQKTMVNPEKLRLLKPDEVRAALVDGNYGGYYEKDDHAMMQIWNAAILETRAQLMEEWD